MLHESLNGAVAHPSRASASGGVKKPAPANRAAREAVRIVAPLWPLKHFVAVNPFLGLTGMPFVQAMEVMNRAAGARMTMPRSFYGAALGSGHMVDSDLATAIAQSAAALEAPWDVTSLRALADSPSPDPRPVPTVATLLSRATGTDWDRFTVETISAWAATYFDDGQSLWRSPWRDLPPFAAWRAHASIDRSPEIMGLKHFRNAVSALPEEPDALIQYASIRLGIPERALTPYFQRLLMSINGWAGFARYQAWQHELADQPDDTVLQFLAVRLAWDLILYTNHEDRIGASWKSALPALEQARVENGGDPAHTQGDELLQRAYEWAWQRRFFGQLEGTASEKPAGRSKIQAAFCIDVRSEVMRRALETVEPGAETLGVAGFFGLPIEYVRFGQWSGEAHCPVLLSPQYVVQEGLEEAAPGEEQQFSRWVSLRRRASSAWLSFKIAAISSFGFVETMGLAFGAKLISDSLGLTRTVAHPMAKNLSGALRKRLAPRTGAGGNLSRCTGIGSDARLAVAETVLRSMSLTSGFAPCVLLTGHGSSTVNNPQSTALDCGACGGHSGDVNARLLAMILNDAEVRRGLAGKGIVIPDDTRFLGCMHDTTTDEIQVFDEDTYPPLPKYPVEQLKATLAKASRLARAERAVRLPLPSRASADKAILARSRDWSQLRPEWGLAGCAAFIAAPRRHTRNIRLDGRVFLHSYDWHSDPEFQALELIMTAPMVVANWICMQYYGSTVDNGAFGSGNKTLHNVTGTIGVLEGHGGGLRTGLPWQSVHDGNKFVHEPMRLTVLIAAPIAAINGVLEHHPGVQELASHGWIHLYALDDEGRPSHHYTGGRQWSCLNGPTPSATPSWTPVPLRILGASKRTTAPRLPVGGGRN